MRATLQSVSTPIALGLAVAVMLEPVEPSRALAQETRHVESAAELRPAERELLHQLVREAILERPEVLLEALERLQARQVGGPPAVPRASADAVEDHLAALFDQEHDVRLGRADAPIRIVAFVDYNCGFCKRAGQVLDDILDAHPDVQVIVKELPILAPSSRTAAAAVLAARTQGKGPALHRALLREPRLDDDLIDRAAGDVGLDVERLRDEMTAPEIDRVLAANAALAERLRATGTPWFVTPFETLRGFPGEEALVGLVERERQRLAGRDGAGR